MPWEDQYGYAQAVKVKDTVYVSGQLSHDKEGNMGRSGGTILVTPRPALPPQLIEVKFFTRI